MAVDWSQFQQHDIRWLPSKKLNYVPLAGPDKTGGRGHRESRSAAYPLPPQLVQSDHTMRISLIGTYHAERGAVTATALLEILERIQPEVVFAEIPRTHIGTWTAGSYETVESVATARYAETHSIDVVPVDLPVPEASHFQGWRDVVRAIERTSPAYRRLIDLNTDRMCTGGFAYLNSDDCIQAWTDIYREELATIEYIGSQRHREVYVQVRDLIERRDYEMVRNIRGYCATTARTCGVFLVGAAHRKSLVEKVRHSAETSLPHITWDVSGSQANPGRSGRY